MISFDTEIAKYANTIIYKSDNLKDILLEAHETLKDGLFSQDDKGNTIIHYLVGKNAVQQIESLVKFIDAKPNFLPKDCNHKNCDCFKIILNTANHKGMTALHIACGMKANQIAKILIERGANIFAQNIDKVTPIEIAVKVDNIEFFEFLYKTEYRNHLTEKFAGKTLLHLAAENSSYKVINFFANKTDLLILNAHDFTKATPLIIAASVGDKEVIKTLIEAGASVSLKNGQNKSAAEVALEKEKYSILPILVNNGATIKDDLASKLGYIGAKSLIKTLINYLTDSKGTFIGLKKDINITSKLKNILMGKIQEFKFTELSLKNIELEVDKLIDNLSEIQIHNLMTAREVNEITRILAPEINRFIGAIAYE